MTLEGKGGRRCPECGSSDFRRGPGSTTGYWAGHVIGPVICSRCRYDVGYGILESLPRFEPPTGEARGSKYQPETPSARGSSRDVGLLARKFHRSFKPRLVWSSGERPGIQDSAPRTRVSISREWLVLVMASFILLLIFLVITLGGGSGGSGTGDSIDIPGLPSPGPTPTAVGPEPEVNAYDAGPGTDITVSSYHLPAFYRSERLPNEEVNQFHHGSPITPRPQGRVDQAAQVNYLA